MTKFIFFRGYIGTINIMDGEAYMTASIYNPNTYWTPEESERIRIERMRISNELYNEMTQNFEINRIRQQQRRLAEQEQMRQNISESMRRIEEQQLRLFQATSVITVNPPLWTKVKIFGTRVKLFFKECFKHEPVGLIFATLLMCLVSFIGIMKLFGK